MGKYLAKEPAANILLTLENCIEEGDTLKVREQDQASPPFQALITSEVNNNAKLAEAVTIDSNQFTLQPGHGAIAGYRVDLWWNGTHDQMKIISVADNVIITDTPAAYPYPVEGTRLSIGSANMAVNGGADLVDRKYFYIQPFNISNPIDIDTIVVTIQSGTNVPDDGKFGGIAALTNGLFFRLVNGSRFNLGNYTTNQSFRNKGATVVYSDKAPAGTYATIITFDLRKTFGVIIRLDSTKGDKLLGCVRDTLLTGGISALYVSFMGQLTVGEN